MTQLFNTNPLLSVEPIPFPPTKLPSLPPVIKPKLAVVDLVWTHPSETGDKRPLRTENPFDGLPISINHQTCGMPKIRRTSLGLVLVAIIHNLVHTFFKLI